MRIEIDIETCPPGAGRRASMADSARDMNLSIRRPRLAKSPPRGKPIARNTNVRQAGFIFWGFIPPVL
jgi:hypothetical protein